MNGDNKKAVLFDMDGVILDSMPYHVRAWKEAFKEYGLKELDDKVFYLYEGAIEPETACRLFSKNGAKLEIKDFFNILERQKAIFIKKYAKKIRPFEDIPRILSFLRDRGIKLGLVTSSHGKILEAVLPEKISGFFHHIVTGDEVERRKPHPDPYLKGLKGIGLDAPDGVFAVENAPSGIKSAKRAGLRCIAITTTLPEKKLSDADLIIKMHRELLDFFNN